MRRRPTLRAIIYLRDLADHDRAVAHCWRRGYRVVGIVHDAPGVRWHELVEAGLGAQCEIVVVPRLADLPEERVPRTEFVDEPEQPVDVQDVNPLHRRPRPRH